jgi:hypothetical protein
MDATARPGKSEARRQTGRREKLTELAEDTCGQHFTQACTHSVTRTERLPGCHRHYARLTCALCGRFLRWLPKPETVERQKLNAFRLARLGMCEGLSVWERGFVRSVSEKKHLSPKQLEIIAELVAKHLEAKAQ